MGTFLKIILRNIIKGPSTINYPFEDSPAPEKLRAKIKHNPENCVACRMCEYVCAGGAIRMQETEDKRGIDFVLWHNTCTFCGLCEYYCPAHAIKLTNDYHTAHRQQEKFTYAEKTFIEKQACLRCGERFLPLSPPLVAKLYGDEGDVEALTKLCEKCRRKALWEGGALK